MSAYGIVVGTGSCEGASLRHLSPSQASGDDEASGDSYSGNGDLNDALSLARDRNFISRALDTMAKVIPFIIVCIKLLLKIYSHSPFV